MTEDPFRPLRRQYLQNARARMAELDGLERALNGDAAALAQIRRLAHQLRGSGGFYGYPRITEAAAALETLIAETPAGQPPPPDALRTAAARLRRVVTETPMP